jgi:hypothetical protein
VIDECSMDAMFTDQVSDVAIAKAVKALRHVRRVDVRLGHFVVWVFGMGMGMGMVVMVML